MANVPDLALTLVNKYHMKNLLTFAKPHFLKNENNLKIQIFLKYINNIYIY